MDGLEHFPSESLFGWMQNTVFTYARQTGIFLPMNAMQFSICNSWLKLFMPTTIGRIGFLQLEQWSNGCKLQCLFLTTSFPPTWIWRRQLDLDDTHKEHLPPSSPPFGSIRPTGPLSLPLMKTIVGLSVPARVSPERTSNLVCGLSVGLVFYPNSS